MKQDSKLGEQLNLILSKGPELGIHTILSYSSVRAMQQVFDDIAAGLERLGFVVHRNPLP